MTSRAAAPGPHPLAEPGPVLRLTSPEDAVVAVPYLVGHVPHDSVVVLRQRAPRAEPASGAPPAGGHAPPAMRADLPPPGAPGADLQAWVGWLATWIAEVGHRRVLLVLWTEDARLARRCAQALRTALRRRRIGVGDVLRVADGRWWSLECRVPSCCPRKGTPYDPTTSAVSAAATLAGLTAAPSRQALADVLAPVAGAARAAMDAAFDRVAGAVAERADRLPVRAFQRWADADGRDRVRRALDAGGRVGDDLEAAWLAVHVASIPVRDAAWDDLRRAGPDGRAAHLELWAEVARRSRGTSPALAVAPTCLYAVGTWLDGSGAAARVAVEAALELDPDYSMARLLAELLDRGVPPSAFAAVGGDDEWPGIEPLRPGAVSPEVEAAS